MIASRTDRTHTQYSTHIFASQLLSHKQSIVYSADIEITLTLQVSEMSVMFNMFIYIYIPLVKLIAFLYLFRVCVLWMFLVRIYISTITVRCCSIQQLLHEMLSRYKIKICFIRSERQMRAKPFYCLHTYKYI